jgi:glycosyltransferase involved in cell wall biosynthesis
MTVAVCFTNFGPYHLARLRALALRLNERGDRLVAYEVAGTERTYPWRTDRREEPFTWVTLFADRVLETIPGRACAEAMTRALNRDCPDALGVVGYARPESLAMLRWARARRRPSVLMSESQAIDHPRVWWKEAVKRNRVRRFSAGLVGGPRHRDYLVSLGLPAERIALGYNAVDGEAFAALAARYRADASGRRGLPEVPYFLAVSRFVPEKNLVGLVNAYAQYRLQSHSGAAWDLVLCGGGPGEAQVEAAAEACGVARSIHRPGFLQAGELARWYAHASAFVHPSLLEPWGLVVNEAAACGLPLLVSDRAGCAETFVPEGPGTTGRRFDGRKVDEMAASLAWMAGLSDDERHEMGRRALEIAGQWGPERFATGALEALGIAAGFEQGRSRGTEDSQRALRRLRSRGSLCRSPWHASPLP